MGGGKYTGSRWGFLATAHNSYVVDNIIYSGPEIKV